MGMNWLFGRGNAQRAPLIIALLVLANALFLRAGDPAELARMRDFAFDSFQRIEPRQYSPEAPVRIIDIDEASLAAYGQWPWPRNVLAKLVDKLTEKGVAAIAFDAVFAETDRSAISNVVKDLAAFADPQIIKKLVAEVPDNDKLLAEAIGRSRVVTGFGFDLKGGSAPPKRFFGVAFAGDDPSQFLPQQVGTVQTLPILVAAAKGNASVNTDYESVVIRRVPMMFRLKDQQGLYPALSIETLRVAQGAGTYLVKSSGASGEMSFGEKTGVVAIKTGDVQIPTDGQGRVTLFDTGHIRQRFVSARAVMTDEIPPAELEGRLVFIGTSAIGLKDLRNTPVQDAVPGVEVHAQLAEQMIEQIFLARPDYASGAEFLYLAAIGLLFVWLLPRLSAAKMALVAVLFIGIAILVPWFAYSEYRLLFDPIYPSGTLAAIYISGSVLAFMRAERDRREIRGAFGLYLSPDMVEQVARNPDLLKLGGELREISVMFTDVRGFTTISEQFDPPGLTRFMNRFLTPMTDLILSHQGTIDKYMGDAIMAFWNAPLAVEGHAARSCDTALAMQARLRTLNVEWKAEADAEQRRYIPVNVGVGINTGPASVGNFGSTQRLTYSCLGDDVNLASRLEGQCKTYAVSIVIGEKTRDQVPDYATLELDLIMVKGKTEPERAYALVGDAAMAQSPAFQTLVERQAALLAPYRAGGFAEALTMIDACRSAAEAVGWQQGYYAMMRERIDGLIDDSPPDWTGVYVAKEK
jgi:adenylate cyclase